jgi:hypothetical protein
MRSWREHKALIIQPMTYRNDGNMADILSKRTTPEQQQLIHFRTARSFDEGQLEIRNENEPANPYIAVYPPMPA